MLKIKNLFYVEHSGLGVLFIEKSISEKGIFLHVIILVIWKIKLFLIIIIMYIGNKGGCRYSYY
jgi:hypothetical protein